MIRTWRSFYMKIGLDIKMYDSSRKVNGSEIKQCLKTNSQSIVMLLGTNRLIVHKFIYIFVQLFVTTTDIS